MSEVRIRVRQATDTLEQFGLFARPISDILPSGL
jgi:hypothetical protein